MYQAEPEAIQNIERELEDAVVDGFGDYTSSLFMGSLPDDSKIRDFLHQTRHYDSSRKRWIKLARRKLKSPFVLREHVAAIIKEIYAYFNVSNRQPICNKKRLRSRFTTEPDLIIAGCGSPSFKGRVIQPTLDYSQCATPIAVRFHANIWGSEMHPQVAMYARDCFAKQLNRRFVYTLWFTEDMLVVHQFDRSGCIWSDGIDIHECPELVVKWILGVSSSNEVAMGFNTTIRWRGRRRYVQTLNSDQEPAEYEIDLTEEIHHSPCVVGPGTTWWPLVGDHRKWTMKEYWRGTNDPREEEFLMAARGLPGVAQMVSYEFGEVTSDLRGVDQGPYFSPRQLVRITQKHYGLPITQFQSPLQLLRALRDTIQGHQNILNKGVLHRNVSYDSIILGNDCCTAGNRGILADLDRATWNKVPRNWDERWPSGVCPFQSIAVLKGRNGRYSFLDDLESFFYVLLSICVKYDEAGKVKERQPSCLDVWYDIDHEKCAKAKSEQLRSFDDTFVQHISPYFGPIFIQLLKDLLAVFWTGGLPTDQLRPMLYLEESRKHLLVDPNVIYRSYIAPIDRAIESLERTKASPISSLDVKPALTTPPKRKRQESAEDDRDACPSPPRKRRPRKAEVVTHPMPPSRRRGTRTRKN
ncbi:hypothetical protein AX16_000875 [Volvariella volvacea WC 439]|nr:hypothetical protein AX16_000875 [Volvariella volvacea WC 439]